jgi:lysophospholipase L1-like esterase
MPSFLMKRVAIAVGVIVLIFGSLITFPAHIHWMVLVWMVVSLFAFANRKPMWPWLVGCVLIVALKRPGYTAEFYVLATLFFTVGLVDWRALPGKAEPLDRKQLACYALVLIAATATYGVTRWVAANTSRQLTLDARPIACLGDSLTDYGYPQELAKRISVPVADFGVDGIKTDDGIKMIPDILAADPQLVVIELGGHDYNGDNKPRSATKANLAKLIEAFLDRDIAVVLVEIPRGFITDPYDGLERELAAEYDLQLIDDSVIRRFGFNSPIIPPGMWLKPSWRYSDDGLHPNALGNKHFADVVSRSLAKVLGRSILK